MQDELQALFLRCERALDSLAGIFDPAELEQARADVLELREHRQFNRMLRLAEAVGRVDPDDARNRRLQAQALIETGLATVAVPLLESIVRSVGPDHPEALEAQGLLGRAWKQIFFDAGDRSMPGAQRALRCSVEAYRAPYAANPKLAWHGVNLLAVLHRARAMGLKLDNTDIRALARNLLKVLDEMPAAGRDPWYWASVAEAALGAPDHPRVELALRNYIASDGLKPFQVASTLRQLSQLWELGQMGEWGAGLLDMLRAQLLKLEHGVVEFRPGELGKLQQSVDVDPSKLEALLGKEGPKTYRWWRTGIERAQSVVSIRRRLGSRVGTGFVVRAGDFGLEPADEMLVLTNFHVVNADGTYDALRPADAEAVFEAVEGSPSCTVKTVLWSSPAERLDAALLRLAAGCPFAKAMPIAASLPPWPPAKDAEGPPPRVYVVGHPGGEELSFSFQDNELLGHEGNPHGKPRLSGVCRVHYRAPTEPGSSGSAVFDESLWEVIALHHAGSNFGVPRLNGEAGTYAANEGIAIESIVAAVRASLPAPAA
jgi:hypothetical protein